ELLLRSRRAVVPPSRRRRVSLSCAVLMGFVRNASKSSASGTHLLFFRRLCRLLAVIDHLFRAEDRLAEVIGQPAEVFVVLLADVLRQFTIRTPRDIPADRPRLRIG